MTLHWRASYDEQVPRHGNHGDLWRTPVLDLAEVEGFRVERPSEGVERIVVTFSEATAQRITEESIRLGHRELWILFQNNIVSELLWGPGSRGCVISQGRLRGTRSRGRPAPNRPIALGPLEAAWSASRGLAQARDRVRNYTGLPRREGEAILVLAIPTEDGEIDFGNAAPEDETLGAEVVPEAPVAETPEAPEDPFVDLATPEYRKLMEEGDLLGAFYAYFDWLETIPIEEGRDRHTLQPVYEHFKAAHDLPLRDAERLALSVVKKIDGRVREEGSPERQELLRWRLAWLRRAVSRVTTSLSFRFRVQGEL